MGVWSKLVGFAVDWALDRLADGEKSKDSAPSLVLASDASFREAATELREAISGAASEVIGKIESDKLELLSSRIRILGDMIRIGDQAEILRYQFSLREVVDYAENRVNEGKSDWIGPLLLGKSAVFAALQVCAITTDHDRQELESLCRRARHDMIDLTVRRLVASGKEIPWHEIEEFFLGKIKSLPILTSYEDTALPLNVISEVIYTGNPGIFLSIGEPLPCEQKVKKGDVLITLKRGVRGGFFTIPSSDDAFNITSDAEGILKEVLFENGQRLEPGMVIARISLS